MEVLDDLNRWLDGGAMKSQWITKVITVHLDGNMTVWPNVYGNPSNRTSHKKPKTSTGCWCKIKSHGTTKVSRIQLLATMNLYKLSWPSPSDVVVQISQPTTKWWTHRPTLTLKITVTNWQTVSSSFNLHSNRNIKTTICALRGNYFVL